MSFVADGLGVVHLDLIQGRFADVFASDASAQQWVESSWFYLPLTRFCLEWMGIRMELARGLEPLTFGLQIRCSTS